MKKKLVSVFTTVVAVGIISTTAFGAEVTLNTKETVATEAEQIVEQVTTEDGTLEDKTTETTEDKTTEDKTTDEATTETTDEDYGIATLPLVDEDYGIVTLPETQAPDESMGDTTVLDLPVLIITHRINFGNGVLEFEEVITDLALGTVINVYDYADDDEELAPSSDIQNIELISGENKVVIEYNWK